MLYKADLKPWIRDRKYLWTPLGLMLLLGMPIILIALVVSECWGILKEDGRTFFQEVYLLMLHRVHNPEAKQEGAKHE